MPPETRKIPQSDWDRHQSTIRALYHGQKLPLWKQNGERCVIRVMREQHDFDATLSQYEAQLRRCDSQKNLKRHEWAFLLSQYDTLAARGCKVRIVLSGQLILESRILRARRHLQSTGHAVHTMSAPKQAFVEYQDSKKDWIRYPSTNQAPESDQPPSQTTAASAQRGLESHRPPGSVPEIEDDLAPLGWPRDVSLIASQEAVRSTPSLSFGRLRLQDLRGPPGTAGNNHATAEVSRIVPSTRELRLSHPRRMIQPAHWDLLATTPFRPPYIPVDPAAHITMHPVAQQILGQLSFLVPDSIRTSSLALSTRDLRGDIPTLVKAIAYSVSNRTVMPRRTQHGTVFGLLSQTESLQQGLQEFLQSVQPSVGVCLADNLFRHAVETSDPRATQMVLAMAQSKFAYAINPNKVKCTVPGRRGHFTPLEVAALQRHVELTQVLLRVGADPNHTYWKGFAHSQGALEHVLWTDVDPPDEPPPVNIELVRLLLDHQAQVRPETLRLLLRHPRMEREVVQDLMNRIKVEHHGLYFPPTTQTDQILRSSVDRVLLGTPNLITDIVRTFSNSTGFSSIAAFFSKCDAAVCGLCAYLHKGESSLLLELAARRGNTNLVELMLPMVPFASLQGLLVLAIRSGESRLVDRLFQVGATVDGPAAAVISVSGFPRIKDEKLPFVEELTPLAEAIRCQDDILISHIESLGALSSIRPGKEKHFRAAATAAAYVGNLTYLRRICEKGSALDGALLSSALTAAIASDHLAIARFLLDTYASAYFSFEPAFRRAISDHNKPAFDLLIEYYIPERSSGSGMMRNAVPWGDIEVLNCLVRMGAPLNGHINDGGDLSLLSIAALVDNTAVLKWLLEHGADPNANTIGSPSPLAVAALHDDTEMLDLLLAHHASVRDELALVFAMSYNQNIFETLLSAFSSNFPQGLPGFGRMVLNRAVDDAKFNHLSRLLEMGMDLNTPATVQAGMYVEDVIRDIFKGRENVWESRTRTEMAKLKEIRTMSTLGHAICKDTSGSGNRISSVRLILGAGADPNKYVSTSPFQTPLQLAIQKEAMEIMELIVQCGADVNLRPFGMRYSPLQKACEQGSLEMAMFLLQHEADARAAPSPNKGGTALQMASQSGNIKLAQLLIDNGADVHEPPAQVGGRTAFEGAAEKGRITMLEFLWDQACPAGFPRAELERARSFAEEEGHRGCAEYIDLLLMVVGDGRTPRLFVG